MSQMLMTIEVAKASRLTGSDQAVGVKIRALRRAAGMTLRDLGDAVGVSCVQFQRYETGVSRIPASRLFAISNTLDTQVDSLMAEPVTIDSDPISSRLREESAELARVFKAISDPRRRTAIIALARTIAEQEQRFSTPFDALPTNPPIGPKE
jgi:transcriptional regulator with XRE-family HTH domain